MLCGVMFGSKPGSGHAYNWMINPDDHSKILFCECVSISIRRSCRRGADCNFVMFQGLRAGTTSRYVHTQTRISELDLRTAGFPMSGYALGLPGLLRCLLRRLVRLPFTDRVSNLLQPCTTTLYERFLVFYHLLPRSKVLSSPLPAV